MDQPITTQDKELIVKYFGHALEQLSATEFKRQLKVLRQKYHPDRFEQFEDETVREMATERFQSIERLAAKIEAFFQGKLIGSTSGPAAPPANAYRQQGAVFGARKMKIEIKTADKELKYDLFGTFYKWLQYGETFNIPDTGAKIIMDEEQRGNRIGYQEIIRIYLTFEEADVVEDIVSWLFDRIKERANALIIGKELVPNDYEEILWSIKKQSFLRIEASSSAFTK